MSIDGSNDSPLGKETSYIEQYSRELLFPIARQPSRESLGINCDRLPFSGEDIWNAYELSWLNLKGKPEVACAEFRIPCESPAIVESKSFKLYLNSLNQSKFKNAAALKATIKNDLSSCVGMPIIVNLLHVERGLGTESQLLSGTCLDQLDVTVDQYVRDPALLIQDQQVVDEQVYSHLLRSLCPVTGQPDWGTIIIEYKGKRIKQEGLLKYIIGYRQHQEFHEQCVERIYQDISAQCELESLSVYARYVRRGGLDINPYRTSNEAKYRNIRLNRQ
jgi:7-cyano-7-deazaguanine reductase